MHKVHVTIYKGIAIVKVNTVQEKLTFNRYSFCNIVKPNQVNLVVSVKSF